MDKQGLVAPVWSDSGEVQTTTVRYTFNVTAPRYWDERTFEVIRGLVAKYAPMIAKASKPADPNAKPALPALTRVSGNKRGPGWCDE